MLREQLMPSLLARLPMLCLCVQPKRVSLTRSVGRHGWQQQQHRMTRPQAALLPMLTCLLVLPDLPSKMLLQRAQPRVCTRAQLHPGPATCHPSSARPLQTDRPLPLPTLHVYHRLLLPHAPLRPPPRPHCFPQCSLHHLPHSPPYQQHRLWLLLALSLQQQHLHLGQSPASTHPPVHWGPASSSHSHSGRTATSPNRCSTLQPWLVDHHSRLKAKMMARVMYRLSKQRPHPLKGQGTPGRGGCTPSLPTARHRTGLPALSALCHVLRKTPVISMSLAEGKGRQLIGIYLVVVLRLCLCQT